MTDHQIDALIARTVADLVREGAAEVREAAEEVRFACRKPEHVRPVKVDGMGLWLMGRKVA